jgi:CheY-like chemotaxis protein
LKALRQPVGSRPLRVLFVDDDMQTRASISVLLGELGFVAVTAANGLVALHLFDKIEVDVVVTDIFMPEEDGIELIQDLRRRRSDLPIVAFSGGGSHHDLSALHVAAAFGAGAVLQKPFSGAELVAAIRHVVGAA